MKSFNFLVAIFAILFVAQVAGCGGAIEGEFQPATTPRGTHVLGEDVATATIGAAGGTLTSDDGRLTLTVPAGALSDDTEISIDPITNFAPAGFGNAYRLTPDALSFASPAQLAFAVGADETGEISIEGLRIAFQNDDNIWELPGDAVADDDAGTVTVETDHLSDWSLVMGSVLMPMTATVKAGESLGLEVRYCYASDEVNDGLAPLGYKCTDDLAPLVQASEWSVNGVAGGDSTVGTVSGSGLGATFHAPATAPSPDTVAVSARLGNNTILVSNVKIQDDVADMNGTVDFTFTYLTAPGQNFHAKATLALKMHDDGIDETNYDATGTLEMMEPKEFVLEDSTCTIEEASKPVDDEYFFKIRKEPLSVRWGYTEAWIYHCTGAASFDIYVQLYFFTGTGTGCMNFDDVSIEDADAPSGEYTSDCSGTGACTAVWNFN